MRFLRNESDGFTLVELVVSLVLLGIIATIVAAALTRGIASYATTDFRKEALDQTRYALERMTREIRGLRSLADIGTANATQFCFVDAKGTRISFRYSAGTMIREEPAACPGAAGNVLSNNITSFSFAYLQANGTPDPAPPSGNTKRIRAIMAANILGETVTLRSEVWPRVL